jgi:chromosomal replication initiation ATPase DnaA
MLERVLGPLVFKSWFTNVRVVEVSQTAIALSAPSQFVAREINRRYGGHLMRCVRVELPAIQSIQIEAGKVRLDIRGE